MARGTGRWMGGVPRGMGLEDVWVRNSAAEAAAGPQVIHCLHPICRGNTQTHISETHTQIWETHPYTHIYADTYTCTQIKTHTGMWKHTQAHTHTR